MIVSDLDGTLLNRSSVVAQETATVLRRAAEQDIVVVAATGRSIHSALPLLRPVEVVSWALCSNGASRYHVDTETLIHHKMIGAADVEAFLARVRGDFNDVGLCWETESGLLWDATYQTHRDNLTPRPERQEGRIDTFPRDADLVKLLITHAERTHDQWLEDLVPYIPPTMVASTSGTDFVEITHATATKGQAVAELCAELRIDASQVVAFGDQMNDLDMLDWAGRGYAMANASDAVKSVASHEAPHHDDLGVARVLTTLLDGA